MSPTPKRVSRYWLFFVASAERHGLDPYLLAAIAERESLCGLTLKPDGTGDYGAGLGIMQIDKNQHPDLAAAKLPDGGPAWKDAEWNIEKGAGILAAAIKMFGGQVDAGVAAYNASPRRVAQALKHLQDEAADSLTQPFDDATLATAIASITPEDRLDALDSVTTDNNYVDDVFTRLADLKAPKAEKDPPPPVPPKGVA